MTAEPTAPTFAPTPTEELPQEERARLDAIVSDLREGERRWAATDLAARVELLSAVHGTVAEAADQWVEGAVRAKGLDPHSPRFAASER